MPRALLALICVTACHSKAAETAVPKLPTGAVRFETQRGPWVVRVEIAGTEDSRRRGLMMRRDLPQDRGMIFVFPSTEEHVFWMHDTLIALDLIFLGEDRQVVGVVAAAQPMTETLRAVKKPSRYVVEVSAGEAAAHAVGPGTRAVFIDIPE
jgi:uncharacterized membrane protein (UPF0127 family)